MVVIIPPSQVETPKEDRLAKLRAFLLDYIPPDGFRKMKHGVITFVSVPPERFVNLVRFYDSTKDYDLICSLRTKTAQDLVKRVLGMSINCDPKDITFQPGDQGFVLYSKVRIPKDKTYIFDDLVKYNKEGKMIFIAFNIG